MPRRDRFTWQHTPPHHCATCMRTCCHPSLCPRCSLRSRPPVHAFVDYPALSRAPRSGCSAAAAALAGHHRPHACSARRRRRPARARRHRGAHHSGCVASPHHVPVHRLLHQHAVCRTARRRCSQAPPRVHAVRRTRPPPHADTALHNSGLHIQPLHVIIKHGKKPRLVIDLSRNLNDHLQYDYFRYSCVDDAVKESSPGCWHGKLDLSNCFLSFPLHPSVRKCFCFRFEGELYQLTSMPLRRDADECTYEMYRMHYTC